MSQAPHFSLFGGNNTSVPDFQLEEQVKIVLPEIYSTSEFSIETETIGFIDFPVIDITLRDAEGNTISMLDQSVLLCFNNTADRDVTSKACLSFFNLDTNSWECVDECLTQTDSSVW
jgi:hypothetical protein